MESTHQSSEQNHFVVKSEQKKFDTAEQAEQAWLASSPNNTLDHLSQVTKITLGGNSYGFEACEWVAKTLAKCESLRAIDFSNIFVSRLRAELPKSLKLMAEAMLPKDLCEIDLSDNAFGPDGVRAFECLLTSGKALTVFKVTNCGLGPEGGAMIAQAMSQNPNLKLTHFHAGRDRLENPGITALAEVIAAQGSLEEIHVPQNGIKDEGMVQLILALQKCDKLKTITVNDNWLKKGAAAELVKLAQDSSHLETLNISDCNMGQANVTVVAASLKAGLLQFMCNYNECEEKDAAAQVLMGLAGLGSLQTIDFVGNVESRKFNKTVKAEFQKRNVVLRVFDDEEDDQNEEDEDSDDSDFEFSLPDAVDELTAKMEKLEI